MNLKPFTLNALKEVIACDKGEGTYFSGRDLVKLFNHVGIEDVYVYGGGGFTGDNLKSAMSRRDYTLNRLNKINNSKQLKDFIENFVNHVLLVGDLVEEEFAKKINQIINSGGYNIEKIKEQYYIVGNDTYEEHIEATVHFEDIQKQIIEEVRKAKYIIWVAVAWFTDDVLFKELVKKREKGLNIQVIIIDDDINTKGGLRFQDYFETYKCSKKGYYGNIMHNKFCIIDLKTVINGSYNWTKKAAYNYESIEVKQSRELAEEYATEFLKLKMM
ncbi:phospholipase D-like domain-containing protein [Priestia megaterium]|uniref:phospholipase D-like domain-containing protein n=1 Tax=Priestia megaterium TaxID=1404 RepID=UPI0034D52015